MRSGADISEDGLYRYSLWREWDRSLDHMVWIMLNPSTADATTDDLTVTKCKEFARRAGCGGITVINKYAYRCTTPNQLLLAVDPEGPRNMATWETTLEFFHRGPIVAAWGDSAPKRITHSRALWRFTVAPETPPTWLCLGKTKDGVPRHPSRLGYDTELVAL